MDPKGLELKQVDEGCTLRLRVKPAARQDMIVGPHAGALKLTVIAAPEKGRANEAVARLLATVLNLGTSRVVVISGHAAQNKVVLIRGCTPAEVRELLQKMPRMSTTG